MMPWAYWIDSIASLWAFSALGLIALTILLKQRRINWRRLARTESGASYSLTYVMSMPLLAMFLLLIVQCTLLLMAKMGVVYASYAAARSAAVWNSANSSRSGSQGLRESKARQAAILAMTPFASGSKEHSSGGNGGAQWIAHYQSAARDFNANDSISDEYLSTKLRNAAAGLREVSIIHQPNDEGGELTVTLRYEAPYLLGWLGRIMGTGSSNGVYYHLIESEVTFPCEDPRNDQGTLGIAYQSE